MRLSAFGQRQRIPTKADGATKPCAMKSKQERARAYVAAMPVSVAGQGGHDAAFNVAVVLTRGFNLGEQAALPLMLEWNNRCLPPWSESDLRHKLRSAATSSSKPAGYLLGASDAPQRECTMPGCESEAERKARQRQAWPEFKTLKPAGITAIAQLRQMLPDAVDLAHRYGFVRGAEIDGHRCFVIHEGTFAQARRLDGEPFTKADGTSIKAKNLPGSEGAFIGQSWLENAPRVLLLEGVVGLLEGMAALLRVYVSTPELWAVIAATSAGSRFSRDPSLLASLAGRRIRIVPDNDAAGMDAAATWLADLEAAGGTVDVRPMPEGYKDIGSILAAPELHAETFAALFQ